MLPREGQPEYLLFSGDLYLCTRHKGKREEGSQLNIDRSVGIENPQFESDGRKCDEGAEAGSMFLIVHNKACLD